MYRTTRTEGDENLTPHEATEQTPGDLRRNSKSLFLTDEELSSDTWGVDLARQRDVARGDWDVLHVFFANGEISVWRRREHGQRERLRRGERKTDRVATFGRGRNHYRTDFESEKKIRLSCGRRSPANSTSTISRRRNAETHERPEHRGQRRGLSSRRSQLQIFRGHRIPATSSPHGAPGRISGRDSARALGPGASAEPTAPRCNIS